MSHTNATCGFQNADSAVAPDTIVDLLFNLDSLQSMAVRNVSPSALGIDSSIRKFVFNCAAMSVLNSYSVVEFGTSSPS
jgi:hypothetical protein